MQDVLNMMLARPYVSLDDLPSREDEASLTHIPHTSIYREWIQLGGLLAFEKPPTNNPLGQSTGAAAAVIKYVLEEESQSSPALNDDDALTLYFSCTPPRMIEDTSRRLAVRRRKRLDPESLTSSTVVLRELILQVLDSMKESAHGLLGSLRKQLPKSIEPHQVSDILKLDNEAQLRGLFLSLVRRRLVLLGIDNGDGIGDDTEGKSDVSSFLAFLRSVSKSATLSYVVVGGWSKFYQVEREGCLKVNSNTEYQGT